MFSGASFVSTLASVLRGVPLTLTLAFVPLFLAFLPAFLLARLVERRTPVVTWLIRGYVTLLRGTPVVLLILVFYSWVPSLIASRFPGGEGFFTVDPVYLAIFVLTLGALAILIEVFRAALAAVPRAEIEAGIAAGFSSPRLFFYLILPQAVTHALPNLASAAVNLIRQSALAYLMTVPEMTARARAVTGESYAYVEAYAVLLLVYVLLCRLTDEFFARLQRRLDPARGAGDLPRAVL